MPKGVKSKTEIVLPESAYAALKKYVYEEKRISSTGLKKHIEKHSFSWPTDEFGLAEKVVILEVVNA